MERYGRFDLSDPFLALQRDSESLRDSAQGRGDGNNTSQRRGAKTRSSDPLTMLRLVVSHCRRMQEKMLKQLAAAESRHRRVRDGFVWKCELSFLSTRTLHMQIWHRATSLFAHSLHIRWNPLSYEGFNHTNIYVINDYQIEVPN